MLKPKSNALRVVEATPGKVKEVRKPFLKCIVHTVQLWLRMNCRYVLSNMERWGKMREKSYRNCFKKFFDWFEYNHAIVKQHRDKEIIAE